MAIAVTRNGASVDADQFANVWRKRITDARNDRRKYEGEWLQNLAFAAGKQHLEWDRTARKLTERKLPKGATRYTVDIITQYRMTMRGDLLGDDPRPQFLLINDDETMEALQQATNSALEYGWDSEWHSDEALDELAYTLIDLGTAAIQCEFDPTAGPLKGEVPMQDGRPVYDEEQAREYVAGMQEQGEQAQFETIHEGRVRWPVLSPFELLPPPKIAKAKNFPWEITVRPVLLDKVIERYGDVAVGLTADADIGTITGGFDGDEKWGFGDATSGGRVTDHVWLYSCFEHPTGDYPQGRVTTFGGKELRPLDEVEELPYKKPDGTYCSGITYFHFWPVTRRFWGRGMVSVMQDPQRAYNKRRAQASEIIDRGLPKVFAEENTIKHPPTGLPLEIVNVKRGAAKPDYDGGVGPGQWMGEDAETILADLERAVGMRKVSLGENPTGVTNYSQLALLRETDKVKVDPITDNLKLGIAGVLEDTDRKSVV